MKISGDRVRAARKADRNREDGRVLSREKLAARVGVSAATIERVERDVGDVAAGTAFLIATELGVSLESLFTEGEAVA